MLHRSGGKRRHHIRRTDRLRYVYERSSNVDFEIFYQRGKHVLCLTVAMAMSSMDVHFRRCFALCCCIFCCIDWSCLLTRRYYSYHLCIATYRRRFFYSLCVYSRGVSQAVAALRHGYENVGKIREENASCRSDRGGRFSRSSERTEERECIHTRVLRFSILVWSFVVGVHVDVSDV